MRTLLSIALALCAVALVLLLGPRSERAGISPSSNTEARAAPPRSELARLAGAPTASPPGQRTELPESTGSDVGPAEELELGRAPELVLEGSVSLQLGPGLVVSAAEPGRETRFVPLAGASLRARWFDGFERGPIGGTTTDAGGRWRIEIAARVLPLSRLEIEVIAAAEGHPWELQALSGPASTPAVLTFDHVLFEERCGRGRVLAKDGRPVPYAIVHFWGGVPIDDPGRQVQAVARKGDETYEPLASSQVLSNEDGEYALALPATIDPGARFWLSARHDQRSRAIELAASSLSERLPDLVLREETVSLAGRVVSSDGTVLPGVRVEARLVRALGDDVPHAIDVCSDRDGRFRFTGLGSEPYEVGVPWDPRATIHVTPPRTDIELCLSTPCAIVSIEDPDGGTVRGTIQAFGQRAGRTDEIGTLRTNLNAAGCAVFPFGDGVEALELHFEGPSGALRQTVAREERSLAVRLVVGGAASARGSR